MKKFLIYSMGVLSCFVTGVAQAVEKFEVLPDLPDPLAYAVQPANAASVSGTTNIATINAQSIGTEPSLVSVVLSLLFVVLLIYLTGIIYTKLNKTGLKVLKHQQGEFSRSQVSVVSTTQLGNNKTLHVVELDGKRMLIGASSSTIQLIKDLGSFNKSSEEQEFSHIEIPNIKIPKIEIPKIEIPSINFSKLATKIHEPISKFEKEETSQEQKSTEEASSDISDIIEKNNPEQIIDSLFTQHEESVQEVEDNKKSEHTVDPEDFALYKKYLA